MTTNKDFKDFQKFLSEQNQVDEGVWDAVKAGAKTLGRFVGPAAAAMQGYEAIQRVKKGDYPGAALSAAGMLPGPLGWAAVGADIARGDKSDEPEAPKEPETTKEPETPKAPEPTSEPIVARKVHSTVEKESGGKKIKSFKQFNKNK